MNYHAWSEVEWGGSFDVDNIVDEAPNKTPTQSHQTSSTAVEKEANEKQKRSRLTTFRDISRKILIGIIRRSSMILSS